MVFEHDFGGRGAGAEGDFVGFGGEEAGGFEVCFLFGGWRGERGGGACALGELQGGFLRGEGGARALGRRRAGGRGGVAALGRAAAIVSVAAAVVVVGVAG